MKKNETTKEKTQSQLEIIWAAFPYAIRVIIRSFQCNINNLNYHWLELSQSRSKRD